MPGVEQPDVRPAVLPYVTVAVLVALPPVVLALIGVFGDHSVPEGQCQGLGFGCTLSPADTARLFLLFVVPVMVLWAAVTMIVLALLRRRPAFRARSGVVQGLLPAIPTLLVIVVFLFLFI